MKIVVVQDFLRNGGTERQSVLLANAFAAAGHASTLLTFRPGGRLAPTVDAAVARRVLQPFDTRLDWFAPGLGRAIRRIAPDVVLCMGRMANCYGSTIQRATPAAVVGTMRTGKTLPARFRRSLRDAAHVVANSRDARDTLVRVYGVPESRISVIYNSLVFPPERALARNHAFRRQLGAADDTIVLLCVAMFRPEKNQRELIEVVADLPAETKFQLWLAGDGPARAPCERRVTELRLGERVKFLGFHADPGPLYAAADIAVHASWSEALSNFLIEAQAHGLPVVASEAQGIRECFLPGRTGWAIPRDDRDGFRAALLRLINEPAAERAARGAEARAAARRTFDPATQVAAHLTLFERLVAEKFAR